MPQKLPAKKNSRAKKEDNPAAFKHSIGVDMLRRLGAAIKAVHPEFDLKAFVALASELEELELKARVRRVREELRLLLPASYKDALHILVAAAAKETLKGFDLWPVTDFVQTYGLKERKRSLIALRYFTELFTSEFAVRPFLAQNQDETLAYLLKCAKSKNHHHRRWASEGSRPRLPWGERLPAFIENPELTFPILDTLKFDPELYVRKSVANHLNDIAKDHPDFVVDVLLDWRNDAKSDSEILRLEWITRHALRSLIKSGHTKAMRAIGVDNRAKVKLKKFRMEESLFALGEIMDFGIEIQSESKSPQKLVIDYAVHYVKANGKRSPKVFKWKTLTLKAGESLSLKKSHALKEVSTRSHHAGEHQLAIQINGVVVKTVSFTLNI